MLLISAGSKLVVHQYHGEASSNFYVDTYRAPNPKPSLEGYVMVSNSGCIPVAERFRGEFSTESKYLCLNLILFLPREDGSRDLVCHKKLINTKLQASFLQP